MSDSPNVTRKLAAIMFTDIVGYTALSAKDENKALNLLDKQKQMLTPIIEEYNGTLHKEIGDGLLFTFPTVTEAVKCGIKIQEEAKVIDDLNLRIGIHEGEITLKDGDALGDDINVASRIEPFSAIGGVAISGKVQQNISSLTEFETKYIGKPQLKGVSQKVEVYCITSHGLPETDVSKVSAKLEDKSRFNIYTLTGSLLTVIGIAFWIAVGVFDISFGGNTEVPSVGILMMENLGSEDDEFWARGITEDLIVKVASAGLIRVAPIKEILEVNIKESFETIAKQLRVKYLLLSSIHKKENGFDLRCQLIEAESGNSNFANKWSEPLENAPTIVGNLAENILKTLQVSTKHDIAKVPTANPEAYEYYLRAYYLFHKRETMEDIEIVGGLIDKAITLDDSLLIAKRLLGNLYKELGDDVEAMAIYTVLLKQAEEMEDIYLVGLILQDIGIVYTRKGEDDKMLEYFNRAYKIFEEFGNKRDMSAALGGIGDYYTNIGNYDKAMDAFNRRIKMAEELDDKDQLGKNYHSIGHVYWKKYDYDSALSYYNRVLELDIKNWDNNTSTQNNIGVLSRNKGDYEKAINNFTRNLQINKKLGDKWSMLFSAHNLGNTYYYLENYSKAQEYLEKSLGIQKEIETKVISLLTTTFLFLTYKELGIQYDEKEIHSIIKETANINFTTNYAIYRLLDDTSYLESAYNQIQESIDDMEEKYKEKFLSYPIPKAIVKEWERLN